MDFLRRLEHKFKSQLSRVKPVSTLGERISLNLEGKRNTLIRRHLSGFLNFYYGSQFSKSGRTGGQSLYLKSRIHPYPGLGHQVSAWLSGALWARDLELKYVGGAITRNEEALLRLPNGEEEGVLPPGPRVAHVTLPPTRDERFSESLDTLRGFVETSRR